MAGVLFISGCAEEEAPENETDEEIGTVIEAAEDAGYTTFASLLRDAESPGFEDTLNEMGPFTIFAPTNDAFNNLPEGMLDDLRDDQNLTALLVPHIVEGKYMASDLRGMYSVDSWGGTLLMSTSGSKLMVETPHFIVEGPGVTEPDINASNEVIYGAATVIEPDINASNGVVHGIDKVLISDILSDMLISKGTLK